MKQLKKMPSVGAVMTSFPYSVDIGERVVKIETMMDEHRIRHLPVQKDGRVVGVVSERDLHHRIGRGAPAGEKARLSARDVMVSDPYVVPSIHRSMKWRRRWRCVTSDRLSSCVVAGWRAFCPRSTFAGSLLSISRLCSPSVGVT